MQINMKEKLFNLFDSLVEKQGQLNKITEILGADANFGLLEDEIDKVTELIVREFGASRANYDYMVSTDMFYEYINKNINRKELIEFIEEAIQKNFEGQMTITIIQG